MCDKNCDGCAEWDIIHCFDDRKHLSLTYGYCFKGHHELVTACKPNGRQHQVIKDEWYE